MAGRRAFPGALIGALLGLLAASPLPAAPARIASLNMCTDQLLLDLVPATRIVGLSPFARDAVRSWAAGKAGDLPILSGTAEDIMVLRPDLVVTNRFGGRATHEFLKARGIRIAEFDLVTTLADARAELRAFGRLAGAEAEAEARIAAIDAALGRLREAAAARPLRVLPLARRGWVSGANTLVSDMLAEAGLSNAAAELGLDAGGFISLEAVIRLNPDAILIARDDVVAEDQGSAMLMHPAIARLFPVSRRIHLPERLTVCGGAMLAEAIDTLAQEIRRIGSR